MTNRDTTGTSREDVLKRLREHLERGLGSSQAWVDRNNADGFPEAAEAWKTEVEFFKSALELISQPPQPAQEREALYKNALTNILKEIADELSNRKALHAVVKIARGALSHAENIKPPKSELEAFEKWARTCDGMSAKESGE